jgi:lysophospholipase L1-like esterase
MFNQRAPEARGLMVPPHSHKAGTVGLAVAAGVGAVLVIVLSVLLAVSNHRACPAPPLPSANAEPSNKGLFRDGREEELSLLINRGSPPPEEPYDVLIMGSSVADGQGGGDNAWSYQLRRHLEAQGHRVRISAVRGSSTSGWIQNSRPEIVSRIERYKPKVVVFSLSLGNDRLSETRTAADARQRADIFLARYRALAQIAADAVDSLGSAAKNPVILGSVYPNNRYDQIHYDQLLRVHAIMADEFTFRVPVIDFLTPLDDGRGRFKEDLFEDSSHPNREGHTAMFRAIDLSLFDIDGSSARLLPGIDPVLLQRDCSETYCAWGDLSCVHDTALEEDVDVVQDDVSAPLVVAAPATHYVVSARAPFTGRAETSGVWLKSCDPGLPVPLRRVHARRVELPWQEGRAAVCPVGLYLLVLERAYTVPASGAILCNYAGPAAEVTQADCAWRAECAAGQYAAGFEYVSPGGGQVYCCAGAA